MGENRLSWETFVSFIALVFAASPAFALTDSSGHYFSANHFFKITQPASLPITFSNEAEPDPSEIRQIALDDITYSQPWLETLRDHDVKLVDFTQIDTKLTSRQLHYQYQQYRQGLPIDGTVVDVTLKLVDTHYQWMISHSTLIDPNEFPDFTDRLEYSRGDAENFIPEDVRQHTTLYRHRISIRKIGATWHRLHSFQYRGHPTEFLIDADSGELFYENLSHDLNETFSGVLKARGHSTSTHTPLETLSLQRATINIKQNDSLTDFAGRFRFFTDTPLSALTAQAHLKGPWIEVLQENDPAPPVETLISSRKENTIWFQQEGMDERRTAQIDTFYHVTELHEWLVKRGIANENFSKQVTAKTNLTYDPCVAQYILGVLLFHKSGSRRDKLCSNMASPTVIRHEYGHFVDEAFGGITDLALGEGWGDILAAYSLGLSKLGEGVFGRDTFLRSAENDIVYDETEAQNPRLRHKVGQAFSGFAWKLRNLLMAKYGHAKGSQLAEELVLSALKSNSKDIPQAVLDIFVRDDDDGILSNGTPHSKEILEAARFHGLASYIERLF